MSDSNRPVSLGCGTLILIALIVLIFSNTNKDRDQNLRQLRSDVQALTEEVRALRVSIQGKTGVVETGASDNADAPVVERVD